MSMKSMPTTRMLVAGSWLLLACAAAFACFVAFAGAYKPAQLAVAFSILAAGGICAVVLRMAANIGQMLFEMRALFYRGLQDARDSSASFLEWRIALRRELTDQLQALLGESSLTTRGVGEVAEEIRFLRQQIEQLSCDCRDINQNLFQIRVFFERIERHLELKN